MTPITHRAPGLAGAVLAREDVAAELICDGYHVHPAMCRLAIAAKGAQGVMAITDGTGALGAAGRVRRRASADSASSRAARPRSSTTARSPAAR